MGLASPAAAAILICYVWLMQDLGVDIQSYVSLTVILIVLLSILMVSNIAYMSFIVFLGLEGTLPKSPNPSVSYMNLGM